MSSNMDRRWGSKKGGMIAIGKVVVPKPINLPSQKSENHGLDPNVEIVPKGTLTWGSKPASAWGSVSPNTDGGSPNYLSGRPSSGSGTRPSTASSDRAYDPTTNSRPASASGALTTNQTSLASLRPRSAETRPGSSQLSRFAENSEHPGAWNAAGTAEKLGAASFKNDEFSLASGDFPTLGSGKESSGKNTDSQDASSYGRPGSSSGGAGTVKEGIVGSVPGDVSTGENLKNGTVNTWRRDNPPYTDDGGRPGMEKWQGHPQSYPGPPPHYDTWHGAPVNNPQGGVWFRGPPGGPSYGNPVGPGGYPMEPFQPYYRSQIPAAGLPNSQPGHLPGPGPRGPHPKNGDMYHMPDPYVRPPVRPGFYPGPVYDGYYTPPIGYCNPNEQDVPYMGMPAGPPAYNRYPVQGAHEPGTHHGRRPGGYGPGHHQSQMGEHPEPVHHQDNRGPYKVLLKQHDGWDRKHEEHRGEGTVSSNARGDQPRTSSWDDDLSSDHKKEVETDKRKEVGEEVNSFHTYDNQGYASGSSKMKSPGSGGLNFRAVDEISGKKVESESFVLSQDLQPLPAAPKDSSLIREIETLNAKTRAGRCESVAVADLEHQKNKFQANTKANPHTKESVGGSVHSERTTSAVVNSVSREGGGYGGDKNLDISRRPMHGTQSRADHHGRGRLNTQELEGRQNKPLISHPPVVVPAVRLDNSNIHVQDHHKSFEATEHSGPLPHGKPEGQSVLPMFDRNDSQEQRAKMKELAKQRTKQLQEEEEERTKKQMAKAWAKLEELNRRTLVAEESTEKLENASTDVQNKQDESQESSTAGGRNVPQGSKPVAQSNDNYLIEVDQQTCLPSGEISSEAPTSARLEPPTMPAQSEPLQKEVKGASSAHHDSAPQVRESNVSKQKRTGYKQKHPGSSTEAPKTKADVVDNISASIVVVASEVVQSGVPNVPVTANASAETSLHPRKRHGKNGKSKHKNEDKSASSSSMGSKENLASMSLETGPSKAPENQLDPSAVQVQTISRDVDQPSEQHPTSTIEESHGRGNSHWKPQQSRRMPRNQQNRSGEKVQGGDTVVWAPVRSHQKADVTDEASSKNVDDASPVKSDNQVPNNSKNKRAEMERYVPKPVAKEMAQQGGLNHRPVSPVVSQTTVDDAVTRAGTDNKGPQVPENSNNTGVAVGKTESKNGNNRHNKQQAKAHGAWRQRGSTESIGVQGQQDGSLHTSNVSQNVQKSSEPPLQHKPEVTTVVKEQEKYSDGWNDWGFSDDYVEPVPVPLVKEQGVASRGKRHASKGHRGTGNPRDHDQKKSYNEQTEKNVPQFSTAEMRQTDQLAALSKENRGAGERSTSMPHWQPKSQGLAINFQRGNRHNSSQNTESEGVELANKPESKRNNRVSPPQAHEKDLDQPVFDKSEQAPIFRHQEAIRERKTALTKGLPNQGLSDPIEPEPANSEQQRTSVGFRRNGSQNAHSGGQSHESRGDWNYSGQDNRQHNPPQNRDRRRPNQQRYEYQQVGPSYNNSTNHFEGPKDVAESTGGRGRGRGQNHLRRGGGGNFYGRQNEVRVDASYE